MIAREWQIDIDAAAGRVFALLAELRDYDAWLPRSSAFHGTTRISDGPIREGTTYIEPGPFGTRIGRVTRMAAPVALDFEQPMTARPRFLGTIGIALFHRLTERGGSTHLVRRLELTPRGPVRLAMPLIVKAFEAENERMLPILKRVAETATPLALG